MCACVRVAGKTFCMSVPSTTPDRRSSQRSTRTEVTASAHSSSLALPTRLSGAAAAGAAAVPVSAGVPTAGDSSGMAPFAAKRAVSRPRERKRFSHSCLRVFYPPAPTPPHTHTTTTNLPIAGPSGAVKTGPIYLLHRV